MPAQKRTKTTAAHTASQAAAKPAAPSKPEQSRSAQNRSAQSDPARSATTKARASHSGGSQFAQGDALLATLRARFVAHPRRHGNIAWEDVAARLDAQALRKLAAMEESGGQPDVALIAGQDEIVFVDCAAETPTGRRSLCYDHAAWQARKKARPEGNAIDVAASMGVELLDEAEYRALQKLGAFDTKTSSWLRTPPAIRGLGGALFGDRRFDQVFVYHNGAESYFGARGFRAKLCL